MEGVFHICRYCRQSAPCCISDSQQKRFTCIVPLSNSKSVMLMMSTSFRENDKQFNLLLILLYFGDLKMIGPLSQQRMTMSLLAESWWNRVAERINVCFSSLGNLGNILKLNILCFQMIYWSVQRQHSSPNSLFNASVIGSVIKATFTS